MPDINHNPELDYAQLLDLLASMADAQAGRSQPSDASWTTVEDRGPRRSLCRAWLDHRAGAGIDEGWSGARTTLRAL